MTETVNTTVIKVDTSGVEASLRRLESSVTKIRKNLASLGQDAGIAQIGGQAGAAAARVRQSTQEIIGAVQQTTAALEAGSNRSAKFYATLGNQRGVNANALQPWLAQLDAATQKSEQAAEAQRNLQVSSSFLDGLRTQVDAIGKNRLQLAEMKAAQLGVGDAAAPMIAKLREAEEAGNSVFARIGKKLTALGPQLAADAAVAIAGAMAGMFKDMVDNFGQLDEMAEKTGASVENLSRIHKVAEAFGTDAGQVDTALTQLSNSMHGIGDGSGKVEEALNGLGLSSRDAAGNLRDPAELMVDVATRMQGYSGDASKAALATDLFGKSGADLLPYLADLATHFGDFQGASADAVQRAVELQENFGVLKVRADELFQSVAVNVLPAMNNLAGGFVDVLSKQKGLSDGSGWEWTNSLAIGIAHVVDFAVLLARTLSVIAGSVQAVVADLSVFFTAATDPNPFKALYNLFTDGASSERVKKALAERNQVILESNKKLESLLNDPTDSFAAAVIARIEAQKHVAKNSTVAEAKPRTQSKPELRNSSAGKSPVLSAHGKASESASIAKDPDISVPANASDGAAAALDETAKTRQEQLKKLIDSANKDAASNKELILAFGKTKLQIEQEQLETLKQELIDRRAKGETGADLDLLDKATAAQQARVDSIIELNGKEAAKKAKEDSEKAAKDATDEWKKASEKISGSLADAFVSAFESGKSIGKSLTDSLKKMFNSMVLQPVVKAIFAPVGSALAGMIPGLAQAGGTVGADNLFGAIGGAGGSNPLISAVSSVSSLYKAFNTGLAGLGDSVATGLGQGVTWLGESFGNSAVATFGKGMQGFGLDGSLGSVAGYGQTAGAAIGSAATIAGGIAGGIYGGRAISNGYGGNSAVNFGTGAGAIGGYMATIGTTIAPGIGTAIGALVGGLLGGTLNRMFGHKAPEIQSQGIRGTFGSGTVSGESYQNIIEKGGWFSSDKKYTHQQALSGDLLKQFTEGFNTIEKISTNFAEALDVSTASLANYSKTFDIKTTGDAEKDKQAISDFFSGVADEIAKKLVPNLDELSKSGETASAALERLAGDFKGTDQVAQLLGVSAEALFGASGLQSAAAREQLIDIAGGLSALNQGAATFNQNFLTDAERIAPVAAALDKALASLGLETIPTTRDQFKGLVDSLIASGAVATESGAKQLSSLLALGEAFAQVHPETATKALQERQDLQKQLDELTMTSAQLRERERAAIADSNRALYDQVQAIKDQATALEDARTAASTLLGNVDNAFSVLQKVVEREKSALQKSIDEKNKTVATLQGMSDALHSTLDSLRTPDQQLADRTSAQAEIRTALAIAKTGGALPDADKLKKALGAVSQDASSQFSSYTDYLRDLYQTQGDIASLADITDDSLSVEEASLEALNDQLEYLDGVLKTAQEQIDEAKGQSITLLSIDQAIKALDLSLAEARNNPIVSATPAINKAYQEVLGRAPDAAGLKFWQDAAASGQSIDAIKGSIANSAEAQVRKLYKDLLGRPADGAGLEYWLHTGASIDAIREGIKNSDEYKLKGLPAYASGGLFGGGLRIVGENGPELEATGPSRIWSSQQTASILGRAADPSANAEALAAAVQRLTETVERQAQLIAQLQDPLTQTELNTRRLATDFQRVTRSGDAMITTTG